MLTLLQSVPIEGLWSINYKAELVIYPAMNFTNLGEFFVFLFFLKCFFLGGGWCGLGPACCHALGGAKKCIHALTNKLCITQTIPCQTFLVLVFQIILKKVELPCNVHGSLNAPKYIASILYQILKGVAIIITRKYCWALACA